MEVRSNDRYFRHCRLLLVVVISLCWSLPTTVALTARQTNHALAQPTIYKSNDAPPTQTRLRFSWGGGVAKKWRGAIRIDDGLFGKPRVLGFERDSSGALLPGRQQVLIRQKSSSSFEGIDLDVRGRSGSKIFIELDDGESEAPIVHEFELGQIEEQNQVFALDRDGNRCSVVRAPGDAILFESDRRHLVFESNEAFEFKFRPNTFGSATAQGSCLVEIAPARSSGKPLFSEWIPFDRTKMDADGFLVQSINVPQAEGVYNLRFMMSGRSNGLYRRRESDREIQFVVLDGNRKTAPGGFQQLVYEITPSGLIDNNSQPLNQISRIIGIRNQQAVGDFQISNDQASIKLPVGGWQAIPISIKDVGQPHLIEIDYRANEPVALGFSILQPDETGRIPNFGFDSGLHVEQSLVAAAAEVRTYRFSFWPSAKKVHLLVANRDQQYEANYFGIRLFKNSDSEPVAVEQVQHSGAGHRGLMAFCEQTLFIDNFAVNDINDPELKQPVNDWVSFYDAVMRMAQYLKDSGKSGAFINVFGEGSSLMPLHSVATTSRFDSGIFSSKGHDPIRKDVVELIYRIFDREGLQFIPVLAFDGRIAAIEFQSGQANENRITDRLGQIVDDETLPRYNPLGKAVQDEVAKIVSEVSDRYRDRSNFQGLAIVCRPDTFTILPGSYYAGYDGTTLKRFDSRLVPSAGGEERVLAERMPEWLDWRANQMSQWYLRLSETVSQNQQQVKLYLALVDIFKNDEIQGLLSPSLQRPFDVADAMKKLGFEPELKLHPSLSIMKPEQLAPIYRLSEKKSEVAVNDSNQWRAWFDGGAYASNLMLHRSSWARFENLEGSDVAAQHSGAIMRLQHLEPAGKRNCERFAKALLEMDSKVMVDGGLLLNTSVDPGIRAFARVYTALPNVDFNDIFHQKYRDELHPVATRYVQHEGATYLYCVNGSPWSIRVTIQSNLDQGSVLEPLVSQNDSSSVVVGERGLLQLELEPFQLLGFAVPTTSVAFGTFDYNLPSTASRDLNRTYYQMRSRVIASGNARPINVLQDPSFEDGAFKNGWAFGNQERTPFRIEAGEATDGRYLLRMENTGSENVWVRSNKFELPETGRLSVSVWLKTDDPNRQPPLRISIESADPNSSYYRFAEVGALAANQQENQLGQQWRRFAVHFTDLPVSSLSGVRIGFDMMGKGQVSVDQVQLFDRWMDDSDLKALTQMFASIGPLLERPEKMEQCRQILSGYWPEFLRNYVDQSVTQKVDSANDLQTSQPLPLRSSMRRRFRRFVSPSIFQFR